MIGKALLWSREHLALIQAVFETGCILAGLLAMTWLLPHEIASDGLFRFNALSALLEHAALSPAIPYSLIGPLFSTPLWLLGKIAKTSIFWTRYYNLCLFALGMAIVYWLLKDRIDRSLLRKFFLLLIVASMFVVHITNYYGEVFTALCVGIGVLAILQRGSSIGGWIAIVLGVANTPATLVPLSLLVLKHIFDSKRLRPILVLAAAAALIMAEAWLRRGSPFKTGYSNDAGFHTVMPYSGLPGFSYPFFFGLLSILFSFGKGLIFFVPGLFLPVRRTLLRMQQEKKLEIYRAYVLWVCFLIGLVLVYASWWSWYGGVFWGPRFFLFASIPASFALALRLHDRDASLLTNLFTLLVLALSGWVGISGAVFTQSIVIEACVINNYALEMLCHYTPEFSVLWHPFVVHQYLDPHQVKYVLYCVVVLLYLAAPLLLKIIQQLINVAGNYGRVHLDFKLWRF